MNLPKVKIITQRLKKELNLVMMTTDILKQLLIAQKYL